MSRYSFPSFASVAVLIAALAVGIPAAAQDDNLRCGSRLVTTGMSAADVKKICGNPRSAKVEQVPVYARNPSGTGVRQTGTTQVETWIYARGSAQFPARLKFEEGRLVAIELVRPGDDDNDDSDEERRLAARLTAREPVDPVLAQHHRFLR